MQTDALPEGSLRATPLHEEHKALHARLVPFAGWSMPVQYAGVLEEARAVRTASGAFDISHMGRFEICGARALDHLQSITSNDLAAVEDGHAQYTLFLAEDGGILDDLIIYRFHAERFLVVVNAANTERDWQIVTASGAPGVEARDFTDQSAMIAVQGPGAVALVAELSTFPVQAVPRFGFAEADVAGVPAILCRTGYTGEDGFEIIASAGDAARVWRAVLDRGAAPCGLGARDTLRIEAGYPLYGHEIREDTTPVEAGLMWAVKPDKGPFRGRDAVLRARETGPSRKLMGLVLEGRVVPRQGYPVVSGDKAVGEVTSGTFSVVRNCGIGMAYVEKEFARDGRSIELAIRETRHVARLVPKTRLLPKPQRE